MRTTDVNVFPFHAQHVKPTQLTLQPPDSSSPTQGSGEPSVPHATAHPIVFRRTTLPGRIVSSPDTSLIRSRITRMLDVPGLSPLEASMLRDYELYGTYYDPPNSDMDELQLPLSDITTALLKIF